MPKKINFPIHNGPKKIRGRINKTLGNNELRDYLSSKKETGKSQFSDTIPQFIDYKKIDNPKVLLIGPCITIPKYMQKRCIPPLGISYVAASLEKAGIDVDILDLCVEGWSTERYNGNLVTYGKPPQEIVDQLKEKQYDIVGLSVLFSTDLPNLYETTQVVKEALPDSLVIVGGLHPTIYPKEIVDLDLEYNKEKTVDFIIRGEGEFRFVDIINNLKEGKLNINADGLVGFVEDKLFINPQVDNIEDIDEIPFPAFHMLPMEKYFEINIPFSPVPQGERVLPMLTTRGCPVGCSFCANTNTWKKHRKRSIENIMEEVRLLKERYNIDELQFADDNLTYDMVYASEKFKALKEENLLWCTPNGTMINKLSEDIIELMAASGMYQITLSLDSANTRTLKELHHKPVNLNSIPGLIKKCRELEVFTHGTLVVGMPSETLEEILDGFEYIKNELSFTSISTFIAAAIPGSELYHDMLEQGKVTKKAAREIDTTKSKILLSNLNPKQLEAAIEKFQTDFLNIVKKRDPEEYNRKYKKLIKSGRWDENQCGGKLT
jgi:phosphonoacetaldehyde methylase